MFSLKEYLPLLMEIQLMDGPVGASSLVSSRRLKISQATIGRQLLVLEKNGVLCKVSNKGRVLTPRGLELINAYKENSSKTKIAHELVSMSFIDCEDTLIEIMEIRELLEPYAAYLAATNATPDDIQSLENIAFTHRYKIAKGESADREDLEFHLSIVQTSKNKTLSKLVELLLTNNNAYIEFSKASISQNDIQVDNHFKILDSIRNHDSSTAKIHMKEHLRNVFKSIENSLKVREEI